MPIDLQLVRDGHVILRTLSDPLDIAELLESFRYGAREIIGPSPHPIHLIFDATNVNKPPSNFLSLWRNAERGAMPQTGQIIFVSQSAFVKTMITLVSHVSPMQPLAVATLDEAFVIVDRLIADEANVSKHDKER